MSGAYVSEDWPQAAARRLAARIRLPHGSFDVVWTDGAWVVHLRRPRDRRYVAGILEHEGRPVRIDAAGGE